MRKGSRMERSRLRVRLARQWVHCSAWMMLLVLICLAGSGPAHAHTKLVESVPAGGAVLAKAPERLVLTFNKEIERSLFALNLQGEAGEAALADSQVSEDGLALSAGLPALSNGTYEVSFKVVALDGHPIEGGWSFEVAVPEAGGGQAGGTGGGETDAGEAGGGSGAGEEGGSDSAAGEDGHGGHDGTAGETGGGDEGDPAGPEDAAADEESAESGEAHHLHQGHKLADNTGLLDVLRYAARGLYYASMLLLLGWVMWDHVSGSRSAAIRQLLLDRGRLLQQIHVLLLAVVVLFHLQETAGDTPIYEADWSMLWTTRAGSAWLVLLAISIAGFGLLFRNAVLSFAWVGAYAMVKALNGHASVFEPEGLTIANGALHIMAAALWSGGLLYVLLVHGRARPDFTGALRLFSAAALGSMGVLTLTGLLAVLLYTPHLSYVNRTEWGVLLYVKLALSVLAIGAAVWIRTRLRRERRMGGEVRGAAGAVRWELAMMALIAVIVGLLTHTSPLPDSEPVYWHEMGEDAHMTLSMSPGSAYEGNTVSVKVWVPEGTAAPETVLVEMAHHAGDGERVSLESERVGGAEGSTDEGYSFPGFELYLYEGEVDLDRHGEWDIRVTYSTADGLTKQYVRSFELY